MAIGYLVSDPDTLMKYARCVDVLVGLQQPLRGTVVGGPDSLPTEWEGVGTPGYTYAAYRGAWRSADETVAGLEVTEIMLPFAGQSATVLGELVTLPTEADLVPEMPPELLEENGATWWTCELGLEVPPKLYALSAFSPTSFYSTPAGGGDAGMANTWGFALLFYLRALPTSLERVFGRSNDASKGWSVVVDATGALRAYVTAGNGAQVSSPPRQLTEADVGKIHGLVVDKTAGNFFTYVDRIALGGVAISSYTGHNGPTLLGASEAGANPAQSIDVLTAFTFAGNPTPEEVNAIFDAARNGDPLTSVPGATLRDRWSADVLSVGEPVEDGQPAPAQLPETTAGASQDLMARQGSPTR